MKTLISQCQVGHIPFRKNIVSRFKHPQDGRRRNSTRCSFKKITRPVVFLVFPHSHLKSFQSLNCRTYKSLKTASDDISEGICILQTLQVVVSELLQADAERNETKRQKFQHHLWPRMHDADNCFHFTISLPIANCLLTY